MKQHPSIARRCAAVLTASALTLGASSLLAPGTAQAAKAKPQKGSVSSTVALACTLPAFGAEFEYDAKIKLTGTRAKKGAGKVALKATFSKMPGVSPVPMNDSPMSAKLSATVGGKATTLKGTKNVTADAQAPVPMPPVKGSVNNKKNSLAVTIKKLDLDVQGIVINCVPADSGALGTLKLK